MKKKPKSIKKTVKIGFDNEAINEFNFIAKDKNDTIIHLKIFCNNIEQAKIYIEATELKITQQIITLF